MNRNKILRLWDHRAARFAVMLVVVVAGGCEEYCDTCGDSEPVVIVEPDTYPAYRYSVEVVVADPAGFAVGYADVELIVAAVPEARLFGYTDFDGRAWFEVDTVPGVTLVAYVSAPGFVSDAGDIGTYAGAQVLHIPVCLYPAY
jgi:hypothetical protein